MKTTNSIDNEKLKFSSKLQNFFHKTSVSSPFDKKQRKFNSIETVSKKEIVEFYSEIFRKLELLKFLINFSSLDLENLNSNQDVCNLFKKYSFFEIYFNNSSCN